MTNGNDHIEGESRIAFKGFKDRVVNDPLTKREYFAAMVMASVANNQDWDWVTTAKSAVMGADALIAALNAEAK